MKLISMLFVALTAFPLFADVRSDAEKAFTECIQLTAQKNEAGALAAADRAEQLWTGLAKQFPTDPIPHLRLGQIDLECRINFAGFMEKGRLMGTIETHLDRAIELDANQWAAHYRLGVLFYNVPSFLRRTDDAIAHLERAIAIDAAKSDHPYALLADLYERKGLDDKARGVLNEGARRFPKSAEINKRLAETSASTGSSQPAAPAGDLRSRIEALVEKYVARPEIAGASVAVLHRGKVLLNAGFGHADVENEVVASSDTVYRIGSISKTFIAAAVLKLVEAKALSLNDPVTRWLPDAPSSASNITIEHLLSHTSGLPRDVVQGEGAWIRTTLTAQRLFAPGEKSSYSNAGYALLGQIIGNVTKHPYDEYLHDAILRPLDLTSTTECAEQRIIRHRAQGYSWNGEGLINDTPPAESAPLRYSGGICSTTSDMLHWIEALREGKLSPGIWKLMTTPATHSDGSLRPHALGFRVQEKGGHKLVSHNGAVNGFVSRVSYDDLLDLTIVVFINSESADPTELSQSIEALFEGQ